MWNLLFVPEFSPSVCSESCTFRPSERWHFTVTAFQRRLCQVKESNHQWCCTAKVLKWRMMMDDDVMWIWYMRIWCDVEIVVEMWDIFKRQNKQSSFSNFGQRCWLNFDFLKDIILDTYNGIWCTWYPQPWILHSSGHRWNNASQGELTVFKHSKHLLQIKFAYIIP